MEKGKYYRVTHRRYGGRVNDVFVAQYLGESQYAAEHIFSFRPLAGTSQLPHDLVKSIEESVTAKPKLPARAWGE